MGLLDAVAGAVRGGAGAVGDIADQEIKTNQAARLQQQHADLQGQLNSQLSDLNVSAAQKIADYQQTVAGQVRTRRAGVLSGATGDDGNIDFTKGRNALAASGDLEGAEGMDKLTGKWTIHQTPWGKGFKINDQTGQSIEIDNPGANHIEAQNIRTNGKGYGRLDQDAKNADLLNKAINGALGPMPMTTDANGTKAPTFRGMGVFSLAHAHAADTYGEESTSVQPSISWARVADSKFWQQAQAAAPNDPQKQEQLYSGYINEALQAKPWMPKSPAPAAPPPSAGATGQPQRDAAAASAAPAADSAAQSDAARTKSASGLLSSARSSAAPAPKAAEGDLAAQAEKETRELEAGKRTDYSPEVKAYMDAQDKARSAANTGYLQREQQDQIARSRALARGQ